MLDGILDRHFGSLLRRHTVLQMVLVLRVLQFFRGGTPMGVSAGGLPTHGERRAPNRDLVGAERGKVRGL